MAAILPPSALGFVGCCRASSSWRRRRTLFVPLVLALILARLAFDSDDDARLAALFVMAVIFSAAWRQLRIGERLRGHADGGRT